MSGGLYGLSPVLADMIPTVPCCENLRREEYVRLKTPSRSSPAPMNVHFKVGPACDKARFEWRRDMCSCPLAGVGAKHEVMWSLVPGYHRGNDGARWLA